MRRLFIAILKGYKYFISPLFGSRCRFYPTCSSYALEAFERHGVFTGFYLTFRRVLKCHPFHRGGIDLVPENPRSGESRSGEPRSGENW